MSDILKLRTKGKKPDTQFSQQNTEANSSKINSGSKLCSWLMNVFIKKFMKMKSFEDSIPISDFFFSDMHVMKHSYKCLSLFT